MKRLLAALFVLALMATGAMALPKAGEIENAPNFRYSDLHVAEDGVVSYTIHNDTDNNVIFHGRLNIFNDRSDGIVETEIVDVPVMAKSSTIVKTNILHAVVPADLFASNYIEWSGVTIEKQDVLSSK